MRRRLSDRLAFTLVELLVVITIIGLLMAMAFPAFSSVREQMNSVSCRSNLATLGKAVINYRSKYKDRMPPGIVTCVKRKRNKNQPIFDFSVSNSYCQGPTWSLALLGELDAPMARNYENCLQSNDKKKGCSNTTAALAKDSNGWGAIGASTPVFFKCPSAEELFELLEAGSAWGYDQLSKGNYAANFGSGTLGNASNSTNSTNRKLQGPFRIEYAKSNTKTISPNNATGPFKKGTKIGVRATEILDGVSRTILFSEVIGVESPRDGRGAWTSPFMGGTMFTGKTTPNYNPVHEAQGGASEIDTIPVCDKTIDSNDALRCKENRSNADVWAAARSAHPNEINVVMVDGQAKAYPDTIQLRVWQALCTRAGQEDESDYPEE